MDKQIKPTEESSEVDELGTGLLILSFFIPIAGAVIYWMNRDEKPNKAKSASKAAWLGLGLGLLIEYFLQL